MCATVRDALLQSNPGMPLSEAFLLAEAIEQWVGMQKMREQAGVLVVDERTGAPIENPAVKAMRAAQKTIEKLGAKWNLDEAFEAAFAGGGNDDETESATMEAGREADNAGGVCVDDIRDASRPVADSDALDGSDDSGGVPKSRRKSKKRLPDFLRELAKQSAPA